MVAVAARRRKCGDSSDKRLCSNDVNRANGGEAG